MPDLMSAKVGGALHFNLLFDIIFDATMQGLRGDVTSFGLSYATYGHATRTGCGLYSRMPCSVITAIPPKQISMRKIKGMVGVAQIYVPQLGNSLYVKRCLRFVGPTSAMRNGKVSMSEHVLNLGANQNVRSAVACGMKPEARQAGALSGKCHRGQGIGGRRTGIVWFRSDLRLHDHAALSKATSECTSMLPVYCFDPREFGRSKHGYDRTGPFRASFLIQSVADLRQRLKKAGSDLLVRVGRPEEVIPEVARKIGADAVYCHTEVTFEECQVEDKVRESFVKECGGKFFSYWTNTLHHLDDLPFTLTDLPQGFDEFKQKVHGVEPRAALQEEESLKGIPLGSSKVLDMGDIPQLKDLGIKEAALGEKDALSCQGGETEGLHQLKSFVSSLAAKSKDSKGENHATSRKASFSGNIAPWLAAGCLSPRRMIESAKAACAQDASQSLKWVEFELLWRDFFRMLTRRYTEIVIPRAKQVISETLCV